MVRHIGTIVCRKQCGEDDPDPSGSPVRLFLKNRFVVIHDFSPSWNIYPWQSVAHQFHSFL